MFIIVVTEIFPHFLDNSLLTVNDIKTHLESLTICYVSDVIPLKKKMLDDDKRLPEDVLKNLRSSFFL